MTAAQDAAEQAVAADVAALSSATRLNSGAGLLRIKRK